MYRFDFSHEQYKMFLERCPFTEDEKVILEMRRKDKSVIEMSMELSISDRTVERYIKSINDKILKEI
jgi:DNA-binding NarL/FixJ family response regulator